MELIILAIYGIVAGILAGIFGIGGGIIIVPSMMFFGFDIKNAIGISVMQMIFSSVYGSFLNIRAKLLDIRIAIFVGLGGLCGAAFSGYVVDFFKPLYLEIAFMLICLYSLYKALKTKTTQNLSTPKENPKLFLFIIGFITGIFAISLGIGGGLLIVPAVSYALGISTKQVVPISLFFVIFSSFSGFISLALHNYVNYKEGLIVGAFSLIGVFFGTKINKKISPKAHKIAVIILYIIILCIMIKNIIQTNLL
ncbi:MAG: sulfite exporter TauE/SafE family protein [Helicobacteraceae bacterium]|nr:sulfite exporter TauE/SafE family protein [Helicobacteraceae bacterium]